MKTRARTLRALRYAAALALVVGLPLGSLVAVIHTAHRFEPPPVAVPAPLEAQDPPPLNLKNEVTRLREEYARGYRDGLAARKAQP